MNSFSIDIILLSSNTQKLLVLSKNWQKKYLVTFRSLYRTYIQYHHNFVGYKSSSKRSFFKIFLVIIFRWFENKNWVQYILLFHINNNKMTKFKIEPNLIIHDDIHSYNICSIDRFHSSFCTKTSLCHIYEFILFIVRQSNRQLWESYKLFQ